MKKFLCLLLVGLLCAGALAGCASNTVKIIDENFDEKYMVFEFTVPKEMNGSTFDIYQYGSTDSNNPNYWAIKVSFHSKEWELNPIYDIGTENGIVYEGDRFRFVCYKQAVWLEVKYVKDEKNYSIRINL